MGHRDSAGNSLFGRSNLPDASPANIQTFFGTHNGILGGVSDVGLLNLVWFDAAPSPPKFCSQGTIDSPKLAHLAITSAGTVAIVFLASPAANLTHLLEFTSFNAFRDWYHDPSSTSTSGAGHPAPKHHMVPGRAKQLGANAICFTLLQEDGDIFTWGDARHHRCLGRPVSAESPAEQPGLVDALAGVPIAKVASKGWMSAAVSRGRDLYVWGRSPPGSTQRIRALPSDGGDEAEEVKLVEIEDGLDVLDVGVGAGHIVALAEGERVFAAGENDNGQLGLGYDTPEFVEAWTEVEGLRGKNVVEVTCGDRTSFVLVKAS